jgi:LysR family transcriptional activator of nhaA
MEGAAMEWLNYHHLYYFWVVAKEGSITAASQSLRLSQSTVSEQIMALEASLGCKLFQRAGRRLTLTDAGRLVLRHADEIFSRGRELMGVLRGSVAAPQRLRLNVGVTDVVPKFLAYRLLEPALRIAEPVSLICHEGMHLDLLARLSVYELDIILTDSPIGSQAKVKAFNHLLGESGVSVYAAPALAAERRKGFPQSLSGAPFLLPTSNTSLRRSLDNWFAAHDIFPNIVGEFEDSALIMIFGQAGHGLFVLPTVVADELHREYGVRAIGVLEGIRERFYAISTERRVKHPAVLAITENAQKEVFE